MIQIHIFLLNIDVQNLGTQFQLRTDIKRKFYFYYLVLKFFFRIIIESKFLPNEVDVESIKIDE